MEFQPLFQPRIQQRLKSALDARTARASVAAHMVKQLSETTIREPGRVIFLPQKIAKLTFKARCRQAGRQELTSTKDVGNLTLIIKSIGGSKLKHIGQVVLSTILLCSFFIVMAELLFFIVTLKQDLPRISTVSLADAVFFALACVLALAPIFLLFTGREMVMQWMFRCRPAAAAGVNNLSGKMLYALALVFAFTATAILILDWAAATSTLSGNYGLARQICLITPAPPAVLSGLSVGQSLEELARGYKGSSDWSRAVPVYKTLLEIREMKQMTDSPATAELMQLLSEAYLNQGKYKKAQHLLELAVQIYKDDSSADDPRIGTILNDLAAVYIEEDKFDQSRHLLQQALSIYEKHRRPNDPCLAESLHRLATACADKGKYEQAGPLYKLALAVSEQNYGKNNPRVTLMRLDYAFFLRKAGHFKKAGKFRGAHQVRARPEACVGTLLVSSFKQH